MIADRVQGLENIKRQFILACNGTAQEMYAFTMLEDVEQDEADEIQTLVNVMAATAARIDQTIKVIRASKLCQKEYELMYAPESDIPPRDEKDKILTIQ